MLQGKGRVFATVALGLSVMAGTATTASAQHVVTEDEAGKLTLAALTAAPRPVYHPAYRAMYRSAMAVRYARSRRHAGRAAVVQDVVYRHVARHAAVHHGGRRYRG